MISSDDRRPTAAEFLEAVRKAAEDAQGIPSAEAPHPSRNENARVYGPPDVLRDHREYGPVSNCNDPVYGPPEDLGLTEGFDPVSNDNVEDYGPPDGTW